MSPQNEVQPDACCEACALESPPESAAGAEEPSSPYVLFDDACLVQNRVTDSEIFSAEGANTAHITGVHIARTAVATITFTILVSDDASTWTSVGGFNVTNLGYFSAAPVSLNARYVKCRATITAAATVVFSRRVGVSLR